MLLRYFGRNVKESWANTLLRYCEYRYREKMGRRKERGGLHAIRGTPSILDRRKMVRCDEKAREESRQLSRVIDRREIRPEISRSLSRFFSPLPPPAFLPDFLPLVIATRTSEGGREGGKKGYRDRNYILLLCNKRRPRACSTSDSSRKGRKGGEEE